MVVSLTIEEYLTEIDRNQSVIPAKYWTFIKDLDTQIRDLVLHIDKLSAKPTPYDGGSKKKDTMIKEAFDLDLLFYYPAEMNEKLETIVNAVREVLEKSFDVVYPKNVSIRIDFSDDSELEKRDFHVDVIVAKRIANSENEAYIYRSKDKKYLKSSVEKHIEAISAFQRRDILRLLKLWKLRNRCLCPGFLLELVALEALKDEERKKLAKADALMQIFEYIRDKFPFRKKIADPANKNHNLLDEEEVSEDEKQSLIRIATESLKQNLNAIAGWGEVFKKKGSYKYVAEIKQRIGKILPGAPDTRRMG